MTEKEKYIGRIDKLKENGLKKVSFTLSPEAILMTDDQIYKELNGFLDSPDVSDYDVLGKYSPTSDCKI